MSLVIRIHSRVPIVDPGRITGELVGTMRPRRAPCGSASSRSPARAGVRYPGRAGRLADAGIPLLGQTVLLAGINDDVATLEQLMRALVTARVKPYYLHHPDLVRGTGHFRVPIARGQELISALRGRLSGLAQPTYVFDVPAATARCRSARLSRRRARRAHGAGRFRRDASLSAVALASGLVADRALTLDDQLDLPRAGLLEGQGHGHRSPFASGAFSSCSSRW